MEETKDTTVYFLDNTMYINVTNLCTNKCVFCLRSTSDTVAGANLWLENQSASVEQIIGELKTNQPEKRREIVFCGYGEPLIQLETVKQVAKFIKENYKNVPVRVNTNGHANLIHKRDVTPELTGLIDKLSVSLNSDNPEQYAELAKPSFNATEAYEGVKDFIKKSVEAGIEVSATIVVGYKDYEINVKKCEEIALSLGAKLKIREWLEEGYS